MVRCLSHRPSAALDVLIYLTYENELSTETTWALARWVWGVNAGRSSVGGGRASRRLSRQSGGHWELGALALGLLCFPALAWGWARGRGSAVVDAKTHDDSVRPHAPFTGAVRDDGFHRNRASRVLHPFVLSDFLFRLQPGPRLRKTF